MENGRESATKKDILDAVRTSEERLVETMRDIQAETLKAYYSLAESHLSRLSQAEQMAASLTERLGILERRITDLERKAGFPEHPIQ